MKRTAFSFVGLPMNDATHIMARLMEDLPVKTIGGDLARQHGLPAMSDDQIDFARTIEEEAKAKPQVPIETQHDLHAGMYARSIRIPAGVRITGALIKIPTLLIVVGAVNVYIGDEVIKVEGYAVIPAARGRKQVFDAISEVYMTMVFPTKATSVEEAEKEFTDEWEALLSHDPSNANHVTITGDNP